MANAMCPRGCAQLHGPHRSARACALLVSWIVSLLAANPAHAGVTLAIAPDRIPAGGTATVTVDVDIVARPPNRPPNYVPGEEPIYTVDFRAVGGKPNGHLSTGAVSGDAEWIHATRFRALPKQTDTGWRAVARVQLQFRADAKTAGTVAIAVSGAQSSVLSGSSGATRAERTLTIAAGSASSASSRGSGGGVPWGWLAAAAAGLALLGGVVMGRRGALSTTSDRAAAAPPKPTDRAEDAPPAWDEAQAQRDQLSRRRAQQDHDERQALQNLDELQRALDALSDDRRRLLANSDDYRARVRQNQEQVADARRGREWTDEQLKALGPATHRAGREADSGYGDVRRGAASAQAKSALDDARIGDALDRLQKMADAAASRSSVAAGEVERARDRVLERDADGTVRGVDDAAMGALQDRLKARQRIAQNEADSRAGAVDDAYASGLDALDIMKKLGKAGAMGIAPALTLKGAAINTFYGAAQAASDGASVPDALLAGAKGAAELAAFEKWLHWAGGTAADMAPGLVDKAKTLVRGAGAGESGAVEALGSGAGENAAIEASAAGRRGVAPITDDALIVNHMDEIPAQRLRDAKEAVAATEDRLSKALGKGAPQSPIEFQKEHLAQTRLRRAQEQAKFLEGRGDRAAVREWSAKVKQVEQQLADARAELAAAKASHDAARSQLEQAQKLVERADPRVARPLAERDLDAAIEKMREVRDHTERMKALDEARQQAAAQPRDPADVARAARRAQARENAMNVARERVEQAKEALRIADDRLAAHVAAEEIARARVDGEIRKMFDVPAPPAGTEGKLFVGTRANVQALEGRMGGTSNRNTLGFNMGARGTNPFSASIASEAVLVHERLHANTAAAWKGLNHEARLINEGVTEHYARQYLEKQAAAGGAQWPDHGAYPHPVQLAQKLERVVGSDTLQRAFFHGDVQAFTARVGEALGGNGKGAADLGKNALGALHRALEGGGSAQAMKVVDLLNAGDPSGARRALQALLQRFPAP